jgi:hypothetical protein
MKKGFLWFMMVWALFCFDRVEADENGWHLTVYGGVLADNDLSDFKILKEKTDWTDSYLVALAVERNLKTFGRYCRFEAEGQVVKHFYGQDHLEFNGLAIYRWLLFPWDKYVDTSVAVGGGLSYATEKPAMEAAWKWDEKRTKQGDVYYEQWLDESERLLLYFTLELSLGLPSLPKWSLIGRLHHRSGGFGLMGTKEGSNFLCAGFRYSF